MHVPAAFFIGSMGSQRVQCLQHLIPDCGGALYTCLHAYMHLLPSGAALPETLAIGCNFCQLMRCTSLPAAGVGHVWCLLCQPP